ncbi:MAG: cytochrome c [Chloroflexota bacterium]|jgi:cytochrome c oxidase subunit 2
MRQFILFIILVLLSLMLVACGGGGDTSGESSEQDLVARGEELYQGQTIGSASSPGCVTCHSLEEGVTLVGPSHASVGARAGTLVEGMSAEEYLRESILEPDAHIVEGFSPGVMYQNYANELTEEEVDALVAYMLTLQ